jgi:hypothetical protein
LSFGFGGVEYSGDCNTQTHCNLNFLLDSLKEGVEMFQLFGVTGSFLRRSTMPSITPTVGTRNVPLDFISSEIGAVDACPCSMESTPALTAFLMPSGVVAWAATLRPVYALLRR